MARKAHTRQVRTSDGGTMTFVPNSNDRGGRIVITRGYKETPNERLERIQAGNRARVFDKRTHKAKGGRSGARREAIRSSY